MTSVHTPTRDIAELESGSTAEPERATANPDPTTQAIAIEHQDVRHKDPEPPIARGVEAPLGASPADRLREDSLSLARRAWMSFRDACEANDSDVRDASYHAARSALDELWSYAKHRDRPFRDLLGMLTAATKRTDIEVFDNTQRDVLRGAFADLSRWLLDYDAVLRHIESFAEHGVDITGPLRSQPTRRLKITIEEAE
jgi:hypothetical protein